MTNYEIFPVKVGEFVKNEKLLAPAIMYLIKGNGKLILVDTGCGDEEWCKKYHHPIFQPESMKPINALKGMNVSPLNIDFVINTHLHWDNCFNNRLFPNRKIYVQKKEIEFAENPLPTQYVYYETGHIGMTPQWKASQDQFEVVDGDVNLMDGLDLVFLPGHTPGFQGVLVNTKSGKYLIAGDCIETFESWEGKDFHKHTPRTIHVDLQEYYKTLEKIEKICDFILPGQDMKVFNRDVYC